MVFVYFLFSSHTYFLYKMAEDNVNTLAEKYQQIRNSSGNEEEKHTVLKVR